jgi:hypothetical protein
MKLSIDISGYRDLVEVTGLVLTAAGRGNELEGIVSVG